MIAPDDPRHGTYAGALQHWRAGEKACEPCLQGARRADKQRDLDRLNGRPPMVPLGERAHSIIAATPRNQMTAATGISSHRLVHLERIGPEHLVRRVTRDRVLAFRPTWSPIGIQRRLQALAAVGWSLKVISAEAGVHLSSLCRLRRNPEIRFVKRHVAEGVLAVWGRLQMLEAPDNHSSRETKAEAVRRGWLPPAAWDDIDDPAEDPHAIEPTDEVDEVAVQRILSGDWRQPANRAERVEVIRRWTDRGVSLNEIARRTGWKTERYFKLSEQVAS